ncbi:MAG: hypothetical protein SGPRY_010158 [Prymnesium sp.]
MVSPQYSPVRDSPPYEARKSCGREGGRVDGIEGGRCHGGEVRRDDGRGDWRDGVEEEGELVLGLEDALGKLHSVLLPLASEWARPCAHWGALQQHADKQAKVGASEEDEDEGESSRCHHVLAQVLRTHKPAPTETPGRKVDAQAFDMSIPWPPLILLEDLKLTEEGAELNSSNLLLQKFKTQGAVDGYPIYRGPFQRAAVLQFTKSKEGLESAKAFLQNSVADLQKGVPSAFKSRWPADSEELRYNWSATPGSVVCLPRQLTFLRGVHQIKWQGEKWGKKLARVSVEFRKKDELEREMKEVELRQREEHQRLLLRKMEEVDEANKGREKEAAARERLQKEMDELLKELGRAQEERVAQKAQHEQYIRDLEKQFGENKQAQSQAELMELRAKNAEMKARMKEKELNMLRNRVATKEQEMREAIEQNQQEYMKNWTAEKQAEMQRMHNNAAAEQEKLRKQLEDKERELKEANDAKEALDHSLLLYSSPNHDASPSP